MASARENKIPKSGNLDNPAAVPLLRLDGISKRYGGVRALEEAHLEISAGRIHALLGENGAGKSTLIKVIAGVVQPDSGVIELEGSPVMFRNPAAAMKAGIACIFQELSLIPDLSVADNIAITSPPTRLGLIDRHSQRRLAQAALTRAGAGGIHPLSRLKDLPLSRRQMVEIAKALARSPKILILDEATSALTAADVERVFAVLNQLRADGLAIVYISHRMHEIAQLADDCTVFRNGRYVATFKAGTKSDDAIVEMMIGREYKSVFPVKPQNRPDRPAALTVKNLAWAERLKGIDLSVLPGEVVGLGGLDGQGQHELLLALFGVLVGVSGEIKIGDRRVAIKSPLAAKRREVGMAFIPEDRKTEGLMLPMSVRDNLSFAAIEQFSYFGLIDREAERAAIDQIIQLLQIRCDGIESPAGALSGGNQQKLVIGKWLMTKPRIILLNDPTRGVDVGTKQEFYHRVRWLADEGAAILFYSTDYDELVGCCDRVLVLYDGAVVRILEGAAITERNLVASALNLAPSATSGTEPAEILPSDIPSSEALPALESQTGREASPEGRFEVFHFCTPRRSFCRRDLHCHVHALRVETSGRVQCQSHQYRHHQRYFARAGRNGADDSSPHRRVGPFGRNGVRTGQLPCVEHSGRLAAPDDPRSAHSSGRRKFMRRSERRHCGLWQASTDYRDSGHRRDLLRIRALAQTGPGGRGQHRFRRCHGGFVRRKYPGHTHPPARRRLLHLGSLSAIRSRARRVCDRLFRAGSLYVRHSNRPSEVPRLHRGRPFLVDRRLAAHLYYVFWRSELPVR